MSQIKPVYAEVTEFEQIAKDVINSSSEIFPAIDEDAFVENIKVVAITNKERGEGKDLVKVKGIPQPIRMFCQCSYVVEMYLKDWDKLDEVQKEWLVLYILRRIPTDGDQEGKVLPIDYKDDSVIVRTVGPDWLENEDLPSITKSKKEIQWNSFGKETQAFLDISATSSNEPELNKQEYEEDSEVENEAPEGYEEVQ